MHQPTYFAGGLLEGWDLVEEGTRLSRECVKRDERGMNKKRRRSTFSVRPLT